MVAADHRRDRRERQDPDRKPDANHSHRPPEGDYRPCRDRDDVGVTGAADKTVHRRDRDDEGKRQPNQENADERERGDDPVGGLLQGSPGDPLQGLDHDHEDRRLDAEEHGLDQGDVAECRIDHGEGEHHHGAWQDEQQPCREAAGQTMEAPPE